MSLDSLSEEEGNSIAPVTAKIKETIQTDVLGNAITSTCVGMSPSDVLELLTKLMQVILKFSNWSEVEPTVSAALGIGQFQLGDEARLVALQAFKKSAESEYTTANFAKIVADMWNLHQTDDNGSIAGGEAVLDFVERYKDT